MPLKPLSIAASSHVVSAAYDLDEMKLVVTFKSGVYEYYEVPEDVARGLSESLSAGSYLNEFVKGLYPYSKIG